MLKILTFILVSFLSLPGFPQGEIRKAPLSPGGGHVTIRGSTPEAPATASPNAEAPQTTDENEAFVDEALEDREKQLEKIKQIQEPLGIDAAELVVQNTEGDAGGNEDELKKLGYDSLTPKALMDERVLVLLQKQLKEAGLSKLSDQEVKTLIQEKTKNSFWGRTFAKFPKLLNTAADIVRDPEAMPGLLGVFVRKQDLKDYGYIWIVIFIFGLFFKSRVIKSDWDFGRRFFWGLTLNLGLSSISLYIFYTFFKVELTPTLRLIGKNFF